MKSVLAAFVATSLMLTATTAIAADAKYGAKQLQIALGFRGGSVDGVVGTGTQNRFKKWFTSNNQGQAVPKLSAANYGYWALRANNLFDPEDYLVIAKRLCASKLPRRKPTATWSGLWNGGQPAAVFVFGKKAVQASGGNCFEHELKPTDVTLIDNGNNVYYAWTSADGVVSEQAIFLKLD